MKKKHYFYFDTEFTGLRKDTTLISIGVVDAEGRTFYGEFTDYDLNQCNEWIITNVIEQLSHPETCVEGDHWTIEGTTEQVREALIRWLEPYMDDTIQFVADVCHYDFVLLIDLLLGDKTKTALDLPPAISPCCFDLNQDFAYTLNLHIEENEYPDSKVENLVPLRAVFDVSREQILHAYDSFDEQILGEKHNALYDAMVVRAIHQLRYAEFWAKVE